MYCKKCNKIIDEDSIFCNYCGEKIIKSQSIYKRYLWKGGLIVIIILLFVVIIQFILNSNEKHQNIDISQSNILDNKFIEKNIIRSVVNLYCDTSVYNIETSEEVFGGSGTITTSNGVILTNNHILPENVSAEEIVCLVILPDVETGLSDDRYLAKPVKKTVLSEEYDLVFLKIYSDYLDSDGNSYGYYPIEFPNIGSLSDIECINEYVTLGEEVKIYGYPSITQDSLTITEGIVSAFSEYGEILTSAKINPGNSGGLAVDATGCTIGVPSAVISEEYENLGLIIPTGSIYEYLEEEGLDWEKYYY